jgi:hypothetical protein
MQPTNIFWNEFIGRGPGARQDSMTRIQYLQHPDEEQGFEEMD